MIKFEETLPKLGLYPRAVALIVQNANKFRSTLSITCNGDTVDGKSLFSSLRLNGKSGDKITFSINGEDEEVCGAILKRLFQFDFDQRLV